MHEEKTQAAVLDSFLGSLKLGEASVFQNLTVYPVFSDIYKGNGFVMLDDAIRTGKLDVTEVSDSGSVPELKVKNLLDSDVLVLDGEELVGAKQNRIVNTTIIIGKLKEVVIPVSCVEHGRWRYRSKKFSTSKSSLYANLRMKKAKMVSENLKVRASYASNQSGIWDEIDKKRASFSVDSETGAMTDIYEKLDKELDSYVDGYSAKDGQVGFVTLIDGRVVGCDLFCSPPVLAKACRKLLRGYALDAVEQLRCGDGKKKKKQAKPEDMPVMAGEFIRRISEAKRDAFKSVGEGQDVRFESKGLNGFALVAGDKVVHMAAFEDQ